MATLTNDPAHQWCILRMIGGKLEVYLTYASRVSCEQEIAYLRDMCGMDVRLGQRKQ